MQIDFLSEEYGSARLCKMRRSAQNIGSFIKKWSHKIEEKMQEKMKMNLQKDENLVHIQQQYSDSFCEKIDSKSAFFWQIWHSHC